ncbi:MAG: transcriptional repressor [Bacteroidales bacterium]|jgi:Fur family ferric uptake transcriptional regulator/Fur family peroxide stress response transcriptional regulator|nr:transcriptional repressor [Bacteroidales bacterium]
MSNKTLLIEHNIKPTIQRILILDYLSSVISHPTADEIYTALVPKIPILSRMTIYNTLNLLVEKGVIHSLNIEEKNTRYDFDISPHAHLLCTKCHKVYDIFLKNEQIDFLKNLVEGEIFDFQINIKGICKKCNNLGKTSH